MSNRVTLAQLAKLTTEEVNRLPLDQIAMLLEDVATLKAEAKTCDKILAETLNARFGAAAANLRKAKGSDTGSVTLTEGGFKIKADLPKKVEWDQPLLATAVATIRDKWQENPADYVATEFKVSEMKYNAWPPAIRKVFEPARTVAPGTLTFKIEPMKEAA